MRSFLGMNIYLPAILMFTGIGETAFWSVPNLQALHCISDLSFPFCFGSCPRCIFVWHRFGFFLQQSSSWQVACQAGWETCFRRQKKTHLQFLCYVRTPFKRTGRFMGKARWFTRMVTNSLATGLMPASQLFGRFLSLGMFWIHVVGLVWARPKRKVRANSSTPMATASKATAGLCTVYLFVQFYSYIIHYNSYIYIYTCAHKTCNMRIYTYMHSYCIHILCVLYMYIL